MSTLKTHNLQSPDAGSVNVALTQNAGMVVAGISTFNAGVGIGDSIFHLGDDNTQIRFPAADTITAETGGSERLRITSDGKVGVNQSTWTSKDHMFEVNQSTNDKEIARFTNTGGISGDVQGKGFIGLSAFNSTTYPHAYIGVEEDGTGNYQGHLTFATRNASNDSIPTERLRITSAVSYTHLTLPTKA